MTKLYRGIIAALLLAALSDAAYAQTSAEKLRIIGESTSFTIQTAQGPVVITRTMTPCAKNKGWLQPLVPIKGIHPVAEIDILNALNDKQALVVDMRKLDDRLHGTIPGSISIPFNDIADHLEQLGCTKTGSSYDCKAAKKVYAFCNGPVCPQSPMAMEEMVQNGFPPDRIYYYHGGMLSWEALGLTVEHGVK